MAFAAQVDQLRDPLPARAPRRSVLSLREEFLGFLGRLRLLLVDLAVVALVERVDIFLGRGDGFFLFPRGGLVAAGDLRVSFGSPFADGLGFFFLRRGVVVRVALERGRVGDGAARSNILSSYPCQYSDSLFHV